MSSLGTEPLPSNCPGNRPRGADGTRTERPANGDATLLSLSAKERLHPTRNSILSLLILAGPLLHGRICYNTWTNEIKKGASVIYSKFLGIFCLACLSAWRVTAAPPADICGPFPILSAPYEEDGALDVETLVREARHVASSGVAGFIWAQSNDTVDLLTVEEKKTSFTALAKTFAGSPVYVTLGCQGRDTSDMETLARHVEELAVAYPTTKLLIACRPPLDARSQDDLERYYRRLAAIARRPVIIQTYAADNVPNPSSELLLRLARERPDVFGWIKEETGEADADTRMRTECAAPEVKTVFSAWGSWGWVRQHRTFGTRGVISERAAYASELMEVWRALNAKDDKRVDEIWKKYVNMLLLKKILPGGEHRNFSLYVLNRLGVFKNMVSREYVDEKKTPGKWKLSTRTFTDSEIAEIERRWKELREVAAPKDKLDVVVIYYPHWHAYPKGDEWFHKGFDEWEFCRTARKLFPGHKVPIEPIFGFIDESKPENVEKEIALAADAGITVFMYDWYWYDGQMTMQEALEQGFLKARNRDRLKFCLMWCYHDRGDPFRTDPRKPRRMLMPLARTEEEFLGCIRYAAKSFFVQPNHWTRDGKPFFSIYNATAFMKDRGGVDGTRRALDKARDIARAAGFAGICLLSGDGAVRAEGRRGTRGGRFRRARGLRALAGTGSGSARRQERRHDLLRLRHDLSVGPPEALDGNSPGVCAVHSRRLGRAGCLAALPAGRAFPLEDDCLSVRRHRHEQYARSLWAYSQDGPGNDAGRSKEAWCNTHIRLERIHRGRLHRPDALERGRTSQGRRESLWEVRANRIMKTLNVKHPRVALQIEKNRAHGRALQEGIADYALEQTDWRLELVDPEILQDVAGISASSISSPASPRSSR